ncbi:uncharacterized protein ColSpa_00211 [Colletotrichum spaethianum]|uniref:Uncharacterized protein n=1 Tax=Colletotrichum spaethianum TaxID=700344 RepID=A0AA37L5X7_9PEZI|nr:uncharacterized protein ColSpa_00211 [Colletotrichum spaethianum]GKT40030.1 hypothetical protein ColSpa_00211 [Colletotrichum spaethianum]
MAGLNVDGRVLNHPVHAFLAPVIPLHGGAVDAKDDVAAHPGLAGGVVNGPRAQARRAVGVEAHEEVDPRGRHGLCERDGLGRVRRVVAAKGVRGVAQAVDVVKDEGNLDGVVCVSVLGGVSFGRTRRYEGEGRLTSEKWVEPMYSGEPFGVTSKRGLDIHVSKEGPAAALLQTPRHGNGLAGLDDVRPRLEARDADGLVIRVQRQRLIHKLLVGLPRPLLGVRRDDAAHGVCHVLVRVDRPAVGSSALPKGGSLIRVRPDEDGNLDKVPTGELVGGKVHEEVAILDGDEGEGRARHVEHRVELL